MAIYYVNSQAVGANTGTSKTDAFNASPGAMVAALAAATTNGDIIYVHKAHLEVFTVTANLVALANISIIVIDFTNDSLAVMDGTNYYLGGAVNINFGGAFNVFGYGLAIKQPSGSGIVQEVAQTDGAQFILENCKFWLNGYVSSRLNLGLNTARNAYVKLVNSDIKFGNAGQYIQCFGRIEISGGGVSGTAPTTLFGTQGQGTSLTDIQLDGVDLSIISGNLLASQASRPVTLRAYGCALHASLTPLAVQTPANLTSGEVWLFDCAAGDVHYSLDHSNPLGRTTVSAAIYANDSPTYDGTNKCSWQITTTTNASYLSPYVSPWVEKYHAPAGAITPSLEILRDGLATPYQDNQVWGEFSYKGTAGSCLVSFTSDRMAPNGSALNQDTSSKIASDWTGENATAWFGKLDSGAAITPQEVGSICARVCVGVASSTVYVDPQIRGA